MTFYGRRWQDENCYQIIHLLLLVYILDVCIVVDRLGGEYMSDYENAILARQEYSGDDCLSCEFRGGMCNGQCTETHVIYNPNLETLI